MRYDSSQFIAWTYKTQYLLYYTRVSRGLRGQGVLDVTWKGADCIIFFLDISNILGPIFKPLRLSSAVGQM
jgi:hypothetical protein